jgi:hypothetical protein
VRLETGADALVGPNGELDLRAWTGRVGVRSHENGLQRR